jgi:hypothetical protein
MAKSSGLVPYANIKTAMGGCRHIHSHRILSACFGERVPSPSSVSISINALICVSGSRGGGSDGGSSSGGGV